jgi:hypothetical protein
MKKILLFNVFVVFCLTAMAQNYSQIGTIGHYNLRSTVSPYDKSYATLETLKDTVISNFPCKKLVETVYDFNGSVNGIGYHFIQIIGPQVYFFYKDSSFSWVRDTLYNFSLTKGESYTFYQDLYQPVTITIDSVSNELINGVSRTVQYLKGNSVGVYLEDKAIEGLGALFFFMPWGDLDPRGGLRCYQDSTIGFYRNNLMDSCDFISVGLNELSINNAIVTLYPNPTNSVVNIDWLPNQQVNQIQVFDFQGRVIQQYNKRVNQINLAAFDNGIYFLKVFGEEGVDIRKMVKR